MLKGKGNNGCMVLRFVLVIWTPIWERQIMGFDPCFKDSSAFYQGTAYVILTCKKNGDWVIKGRLI